MAFHFHFSLIPLPFWPCSRFLSLLLPLFPLSARRCPLRSLPLFSLAPRLPSLTLLPFFLLLSSPFPPRFAPFLSRRRIAILRFSTKCTGIWEGYMMCVLAEQALQNETNVEATKVGETSHVHPFHLQDCIPFMSWPLSEIIILSTSILRFCVWAVGDKLCRR